jgi:[ribosomal protein S18]-alanine N-acetyltransferase
VSDCACSGAPGWVSGFISSRVVLDEAEILTIAVKDGMRKKGIGKELLNFHIVNLNYRGVKSIYLEVAENNTPAVNLYKGIGFSQIGVRKSYYRGIDGNRTSALTMKLAIT